MKFRPELSWEFEPTEQIEARSVRAIRNHVQHLKDVSPYYREVLADIDPLDIKTVDHISKLPTTEKDTLVRHIDRFWAVSPKKVAETVVTGGSSGRPLVFFLTPSDLDRLAFNEALSFHGAGVKSSDRAQIMISLDGLSLAGIAYYRGLTSLGANIARVGTASFQKVKHCLDLLKPTVLIGTPTYISNLARQLTQSGYSLQHSSIRKIFCCSENIRGRDMTLNETGSYIREAFGADVYSTFWSTELMVSYSECEARAGCHSHPELVYTEIVDESGSPVPDGTPGELVATPLGVEGVPLLRYRTGEITFKIPGSCECGRNSLRIGPILSRSSQKTLTIKGTTIYPAMITSVLDQLDCLEDYLIVLEGDEGVSDQVTIHAVTHPTKVITISDQLREKARVSFPVLVTNTATIKAQRGEGRKMVKILDKRNRKR